MPARRWVIGIGAGAMLVAPSTGLHAQEGVFMRPDEAPRHLFPDASIVSDRTIAITPGLRREIRDRLGRAPSLWEASYRVFTLEREGRRLGTIIVVEEIGKHRPITFAVAVNVDGTIHDLAVLAYREAYGGEIKERRFLRQYTGKSLADPLAPYRDVRNIAGATLSVEATGRAARKAIAVLQAIGDLP